VDAAPPEIANYGQRLTFESMTLAPNRHGRRNIMAMGSLPRLPSTRVNHDILMGLVARRVADKRILKLIRGFLTCGVLADGLVGPTEEPRKAARSRRFCRT